MRVAGCCFLVSLLGVHLAIIHQDLVVRDGKSRQLAAIGLPTATMGFGLWKAKHLDISKNLAKSA